MCRRIVYVPVLTCQVSRRRGSLIAKLQSAARFPDLRCNVSGRTVAFILMVACPATLLVRTAAARGRLPDAVRLVRRGIVGDRFVMQTTTHTTSLLRYVKDETNDDTNTDSTEIKTSVQRVRAVDADGALQLEERNVDGSNTIIKNGEREVVAIKPDAWVDKYNPNGARLSRTRLPGKPTTGTLSDTNEPDTGRQPAPEMDNRLTNEPPFPEKIVHVGDTWNGTMAMLPVEISSDPQVAYTAKLAAIELHRNVPCARVEYSFSTSSTKLPLMISKSLSEAATGVGSLKFAGSLTDYYTLDRGAVFDSVGKLSITMKFNLTEPNPNGNQDLHRLAQVTIKSNGSATMVTFPQYAPELVTSATADK